MVSANLARSWKAQILRWGLEYGGLKNGLEFKAYPRGLNKHTGKNVRWKPAQTPNPKKLNPKTLNVTKPQMF